MGDSFATACRRDENSQGMFKNLTTVQNVTIACGWMET